MEKIREDDLMKRGLFLVRNLRLTANEKFTLAAHLMGDGWTHSQVAAARELALERPVPPCEVSKAYIKHFERPFESWRSIGLDDWMLDLPRLRDHLRKTVFRLTQRGRGSF